MYKFKIPFKIVTSHNIEEFEFQGDNNIELEFKNNSFVIELDKDYQIDIKKVDNNFHFEVECNEKEINIICDILESILSILIDENNLNRHYGNYIIEIDKFKISIISNRGIRDNLSITSTKHKVINFQDKYKTDDFIIQTYHEALKTPNEKLKYFNLFLILEYIENSGKYKEIFLNKNDFLFKKEDFENCKEYFNEEQFNRLKQLANNKTFTTQNRKDKLYLILKEFDALKILSVQGSIELSKDDIKDMLTYRNKIFHSSRDDSYKNILWLKLFPLCENIVNKVLKGQLCIEK